MTKQEAKEMMAKMMAKGVSVESARDDLYSLAKAEGFWGENHYVLVRLTDEINLEAHGSYDAIAEANEARSRQEARDLEATEMTASEAGAFYATTDHEEV